jgi:phosphate:Na+ symporter
MTINIVFAIFKLLGGLGLFIYGMKVMSEGLQNTAGDNLRNGLEKLTSNRFAGLAIGTGVTAVIQSSSATSVMVIGFVNAGIMTLMQATPVMMGASIGTTITAQIAALKLTNIAPIFLFIGVMVMMLSSNRKVKRIGEAIAGFGILFMGLSVMSDAVRPLRDLPAFTNFILGLENPLYGIIFGTLFTAIIQSSSATMGILIALAGQGLLTLDSSVFLIMGLNIGTCITALLASIGTTNNAKKAAYVHLVFNSTSVVLFFILVTFLPVVDWVKSLTASMYPSHSEYDLAKSAMANFHTILNLTTGFALIGVPGFLIKVSGFFVRGEDEEMQPSKKLRHITAPSIIDTPGIALGQVIKEVKDMADLALDNYSLSMKAFFKGDQKAADKVLAQEEVVNYYNHELTDFLAKLSAEEQLESDSLLIADLFHIITDIERISDHAENIVEFSNIRYDKNVEFTKVAQQELTNMKNKVTEALEKSIIAFETADKEYAKEVIVIEEIVDTYEKDYKKNHIKRLSKGQCSPRASMIFTDLINNFERVADHATNIAYMVLEGQREKN